MEWDLKTLSTMHFRLSVSPSAQTQQVLTVLTNMYQNSTPRYNTPPRLTLPNASNDGKLGTKLFAQTLWTSFAFRPYIQ